MTSIRRSALSRRRLLTLAGSCGLTSVMTGPALAGPASATKPALFLIGNSTIRNGSFDNGATAGQFGWGHMLHYYFDTARLDVINDAMGGTSSRSFQDSPTLWPNVRKMIRPGDTVLMAFGHNDDQGRSGPGNGDELHPAPPAPTSAPPAAPAMVHSFGWYMRQYIEAVRAKGATPIVLSLIPRNRWQDGKVVRNTGDYATWAKAAADQEKVQFIPLNDLIADKYDAIGQERVTAELFPPGEVVHPNWTGAALNARTVVEGLRALDTPLKAYLLADPQVPAVPDITPPARGEMGPTAMAPASRTPGP